MQHFFNAHFGRCLHDVESTRGTDGETEHGVGSVDGEIGNGLHAPRRFQDLIVVGDIHRLRRQTFGVRLQIGQAQIVVSAQGRNNIRGDETGRTQQQDFFHAPPPATAGQ